MEVTVVKHEEKDLKVRIFCCQIDGKVKKLKQHIELFDENIRGKRNNETVFVKLSEVLYFEVVDNRTFLYTVDDVLEVEQKLYELESVLSTRDYIRSSKSQIINIHKIASLKPELNRSIQATLCNGERLNISRRYAKEIKDLLGI